MTPRVNASPSSSAASWRRFGRFLERLEALFEAVEAIEHFLGEVHTEVVGLGSSRRGCRGGLGRGEGLGRTVGWRGRGGTADGADCVMRGISAAGHVEGNFGSRKAAVEAVGQVAGRSDRMPVQSDNPV